uniref:Uncharacterized protein n=1 Tax=Urocitellus parryii TaxID=9999 RepID=A0A8D2HPU9_UROPR
MSKVNLTSSNSWYSASCCCIILRISIISCSLASSIFRNFSRSPVMAPSSSRMRSSAALAWEGQVARSAQPLLGLPLLGQPGAGVRAAPWPGRSAPAPGGRAARARPAGCAAPPGPAPGARRTPAAGRCPPPPGAARAAAASPAPPVWRQSLRSYSTVALRWPPRESPGGRQGPRGAAHTPSAKPECLKVPLSGRRPDPGSG